MGIKKKLVLAYPNKLKNTVNFFGNFLLVGMGMIALCKCWQFAFVHTDMLRSRLGIAIFCQVNSFYLSSLLFFISIWVVFRLTDCTEIVSCFFIVAHVQKGHTSLVIVNTTLLLMIFRRVLIGWNRWLYPIMGGKSNGEMPDLLYNFLHSLRFLFFSHFVSCSSS